MFKYSNDGCLAVVTEAFERRIVPLGAATSTFS